MAMLSLLLPLLLPLRLLHLRLLSLLSLPLQLLMPLRLLLPPLPTPLTLLTLPL